MLSLPSLDDFLLSFSFSFDEEALEDSSLSLSFSFSLDEACLIGLDGGDEEDDSSLAEAEIANSNDIRRIE